MRLNSSFTKSKKSNRKIEIDLDLYPDCFLFSATYIIRFTFQILMVCFLINVSVQSVYLEYSIYIINSTYFWKSPTGVSRANGLLAVMTSL